MREAPEKQASVLMEIVRGERPIYEVATVGITVAILENGLIVADNPEGIFVDAQAEDVARGILAYAERPAELDSYAAFLAADAIPCMMDNDPEIGGRVRSEEERILAILYDVQRGKGLPVEQLEFLRELTARGT